MPTFREAPTKHYRVVLENYRDQWLYEIDAPDRASAVRRAKAIAEEDGWNGMLLGEPKVERLG
jgi:hypothetical protein